jgi:hypothetical protein
LLTFTDFFKVMLFDEILSIPHDNECARGLSLTPKTD